MTTRLIYASLTAISLFALNSIAATPPVPTQSATVTLNGYWQNFTNPAETPVLLSAIPSGYKTVIIAFADLANDGTASFNLQGPPYSTLQDGVTQFNNDIKTLQARGVKVLLSLGGQNGYYSLNSLSAQQNFVNSLKTIIADYGFDGLDYDFENGLTNANSTYLVAATSTLKQDFASAGKTLIFTTAPETIDVYWQLFHSGKYDQLIQAGLINSVQTQLYNSGCMLSYKPGSPCYGQASEDFIVSQVDSTIQTWIKNGVSNADSLYVPGLPATATAAGGGYVDPVTVKKAFTCLRTLSECDTYIPTQAYPKLTVGMTWDINWDAKNNYAFVQALTQ